MTQRSQARQIKRLHFKHVGKRLAAAKIDDGGIALIERSNPENIVVLRLCDVNSLCEFLEREYLLEISGLGIA